MQVPRRFVTYVHMRCFRLLIVVCLASSPIATSPLLAQTNCSAPSALDWIVGEWSVEGHSDFWVNWSEAWSENLIEAEMRPYLIGRGQLPVEVNYELQLVGEDIYLSRVEATTSSRNIMTRCSQDYWFFGDDGGYLIARSGDELLALMRVPSEAERADTPVGLWVYASGVELVRREAVESGITLLPFETGGERAQLRRLLRNTIREAAQANRPEQP